MHFQMKKIVNIPTYTHSINYLSVFLINSIETKQLREENNTTSSIDIHLYKYISVCII